MVSDISLSVIDKSYWLTKDKAWNDARKAGWPYIEAMLQNHKTKKGLAPIKQYYLKGKMPNWDTFRDWESSERHLDLFCFIWLHPSWDDTVLKPLRGAYLASDLIIQGDIEAGFGLLFNTISSCSYEYEGQVRPDILNTDGHNEIMFNVLYGELSEKECEIQGYTTYDPVRDFGLPKRKYSFKKASTRALCTLSSWLTIKNMLPINKDMIFQYDKPLEWLYQSILEEDYFNQRPLNKKKLPQYELALWRIYNFDTEKEGPSARTTFVTKMRKMLGERPFTKEITDIWQRVKAGYIQPDDPWER